MALLARPEHHPAVVWDTARHWVACRGAARHAPRAMARAAEAVAVLGPGAADDLAPELGLQGLRELRAARDAPAVQAFVQQGGYTGWADVMVRLRAAPTFTAAEQMLRPLLGCAPGYQDYLLVQHAPAPWPARFLERIQREHPATLAHLSTQRPDGGLCTTTRELLGAAATLTRRGVAWGASTPSLEVPVGLFVRLPPGEWAALGRQLRVPARAEDGEEPGPPSDGVRLLGDVLHASVGWTIARVAAGDARALVELQAAAVDDLPCEAWYVAIYGRHHGPRRDERRERLEHLAVLRRATVDAAGWRRLCTHQPALALAVLQAWAHGAPTPAWWQRSEVAALLAHGDRDTRLATTAVLQAPAARVSEEGAPEGTAPGEPRDPPDALDDHPAESARTIRRPAPRRP